MIPFALYQRIESRAGGLYASNRAMIKAFHGTLSPLGKSRNMKDRRHALIREILELQTTLQKQSQEFKL